MEITIEEADPSAWQLNKFVGDYLAANGFPGVEVNCEW